MSRTMLIQKLQNKSWEQAHNHDELQIGFVDFAEADETLQQYRDRMTKGGVDTIAVDEEE